MIGPVVTSTRLVGFKCFADLKFPLSSLTLMTGFNGGGKSTALQPLLLLTQALKSGHRHTLPLNGPLVGLGTAGDIASATAPSGTIFEIAGPSGKILCWPILSAGERVLPLAEPLVESELASHLAMLNYIGAVRAGPDDAFPLPDRVDYPDTGSDGRYAPFWFDRLADEDVPAERRCPEVSAGTFRRQFDGWLSRLFPGAEANVQISPTFAQAHLEFRLRELGSWSRPSNIGYGLTYVFPILVALLSARVGQIVVIDSPESHLHPSAQSAMGRLLASFAAAGVQIVVETHSDHLLNGVRLAVKDGVLRHDALAVHFFRGASGTDHGVISPTVGVDGSIYEWPEGFFDQSEIDLSRLAGWT